MSTASNELLERLVEVTGTSVAEAEHLLGACANDVEAAVALYFEQGTGANVEPEAAPTSANNEEEEVRAPIPPIREQLIGPEDDNFLPAASSTAGTSRLARVTQRVKVCPLRDFAREGALMEEQLNAANTPSGVSTSMDGYVGSSNGPPRKRARAAGMVAASQAKAANTSRLGDLFRPPTDIAYAGTFLSARSRASHLKHWLLVNVQSDNFASQLLNRDVWADKEVRKFMRRQFMLWQIDADSKEGRRFVTFYHCAKQPYVCVIDPRTGEEVWKSPDPKQATMLLELRQFLRDHKDFSQEMEDDAPSTSKRITERILIEDDEEEASTSSAITTNGGKRNKVIELSEEEQLALAIRNSMRENGIKAAAAANRNIVGDDDNSSDFDSADDADVDPKNYKICSFEDQLGSCNNELTMIKLRLLNVEGTDEVVQLRWPSDTLVKVLHTYIGQRHVHIPKQGYKLICAFPRKTLETEHDNCSLKEMGLHPSANLHVTLDD